jgi:glycosyltransferase involved in cell wall biosynthesis
MPEYPVEISVVVPVYNSEKTLNELNGRLRVVLGEQLKKTFEVIFVDDHSTDNSWAILEELQRIDPRVKIIRLIRNFGQHNATICGFRHCSGEYVITMDDDLQHPPEEIPKLINKIEDGNNVVFGVFAHKKHNMFRNLGSGLINYLQNRILGKPKQLYFTSFRVLRRKVVEQIADKAKSEYCYICADILKYAAQDKIANVRVEHHSRKAGHSNYTIIKLLSLASNLLINYSAIPLRFMICSGFAISAGCLVYALYVLLRVVFEGPIKIVGWASLAFLTTFLFGMMFLFLGILGEYIFRVLRELSGNEPYIIKETHGFEMPEQKKMDINEQ